MLAAGLAIDQQRRAPQWPGCSAVAANEVGVLSALAPDPAQELAAGRIDRSDSCDECRP